MKKLCFGLILFVLPSCGLFGGIDYGPAVLANKGQAAIYEELRAAFVAVVMSSPNATEDQKTKALADIESNRIDFYSFNTSLEQFLTTAGKIDPERILQLAKESYDWYKNRSKEEG